MTSFNFLFTYESRDKRSRDANIKFFAVAKLETVSVNHLKVMTVFRFYVNEALSHALINLLKVIVYLSSGFISRHFLDFGCHFPLISQKNKQANKQKQFGAGYPLV